MPSKDRRTGPVAVLGIACDDAGTGLDAAVVVTDGEMVAEFGPAAHRDWSAHERAVVSGPDAAAAAEQVETAAAELGSRFEGVELAGFGGFSAPAAQEPLGDGSVLAEVLDCPVVWDFASADLQLGGAGGPLGAFYHFALARRLGATTPLAVLDLGVTAVLTWIDPRAPRPEAEGALLALEAGPVWPSATGAIDTTAVAHAMAAAFFYRMPPRRLDAASREALAAMTALATPQATAAVRAALTLAAIIDALDHCPIPPDRILVCGRGQGDGALLEALAEAANCPVRRLGAPQGGTDRTGAEAVAFLARRVALGLPTTAPGTTGVSAAVGGGTISRPGGIIAH